MADICKTFHLAYIIFGILAYREERMYREKMLLEYREYDVQSGHLVGVSGSEECETIVFRLCPSGSSSRVVEPMYFHCGGASQASTC